MCRRTCWGALALVLLGALSASAQEADSSESEAQIKAAIKAYEEAFNAKDAKALAMLWSEEGVYISPMTGESISGRAALEADFAAQFEASKDTKLVVASESIQFVSPNVAVEKGTARILEADQPLSNARYSAVYIKSGGQWLLDRVTEEVVIEPPSHYEQLKELEWMVGTWVDQDESLTITTECKWTRNNNFLMRAFQVAVEGRSELSGIQLIGWDPAKKQIRSWVFDSDGGFGQGVWEKKGDRWYVKTSATLADGRTGSSVSVFRPITEDEFGWQRVNVVVGGQILPNIDEVIITRAE